MKSQRPSTALYHAAGLAVLTATVAASRPVAVAALVGEMKLSGKQAPTEALILPAGSFRARDGRPSTDYPELASWHVDARIAARLIAQVADARGDVVIDYEHQTLNAEDNGQPAPAAGWFRELEWREGLGLYATDVLWTANAARHIEAGEYRYISPVFEFDPTTGEVTTILMAALTNYPALDGHSDLAARAAARFSTHEPEEDASVKREELIALLGLAATATDDDIQAALKAGVKAGTELTALRAELGVKEGDDAKAAIATLKSAPAQAKPDMSQFVPKAVHDETVAQLKAVKASGETSEIDRLIDEGLTDGRIAGQATAAYLREQGLVALKAHLADAPSLAALKGSQTQGKAPEGDDKPGELNEEELAVCKSMGITPEAFKASKASA